MPSKDELMELPDDVIDELGHLLSRIQHGEEGQEPNVKRFHEDPRIEHLLKLVSRGNDGNTYRGVATVEFPEGVWVIDNFKKQSTSGVSTPKPDRDRIYKRLQRLKDYRKTTEGLAEIAGMNAEYQAALKKQALEAKSTGPRRK